MFSRIQAFLRGTKGCTKWDEVRDEQIRNEPQIYSIHDGSQQRRINWKMKTVKNQDQISISGHGDIGRLMTRRTSQSSSS